MLSSSIDKFTSKPSRRRSKVIVPPDVRMTNISVLHLYMYAVAVSGCLRGSGGKKKKGTSCMWWQQVRESHHHFTLEGTSSCSIHHWGIQEGTFAVNMGAPGGPIQFLGESQSSRKDVSKCD